HEGHRGGRAVGEGGNGRGAGGVGVAQEPVDRVGAEQAHRGRGHHQGGHGGRVVARVRVRGAGGDGGRVHDGGAVWCPRRHHHQDGDGGSAARREGSQGRGQGRARDVERALADGGRGERHAGREGVRDRDVLGVTGAVVGDRDREG